MKKFRTHIFFLLVSIAIGLPGSAQSISNVHIVTDPKNRLPGLSSFHFSVNGSFYKLKAGQCLDLQVSGSTIDIIVQDKRLIKQKTEDLHTPAAPDVYVWVVLKFNGTLKEASYAVETICKSCY